MRIAIDFDDTLVCTKEKVREYLDKNNIKELEDKEHKTKFFNENAKDIFSEVVLKEGAKKYLDLLSKDNELFIITARSNYYYDGLKDLIGKFIKDNLPIKEIYFDCIYEAKAEKCEELNIDLFIDDNIDNCYFVREKGIDVLLFETKDENFKTVNSWEEVYNYIKG